MPLVRWWWLAPVAASLALSACGDPRGPGTAADTGPVEPGDAGQDAGPQAEDDAAADEEAADDQGPRVVAINAPITDLVAHVMGDRGELEVLLPDGADHHAYEPSPQDAATLADAELFFGNGLGLKPDSVRLAQANLPDDAPIVLLAEEAVPENERVYDHGHGDHDHDDHGHDGTGPNPHAWMNIGYAMAYVDAIADALVGIDPDGQPTYRNNSQAYREHLAAVDEAIADAVETIPEGNRKVVTFHDSWAYFVPRYSLEQVGAVQPSDYSEPSAAEVREVIDQIRAEDVPAVFGSEQFPSGVLDAIAEETGAKYVADLSDERLPGEPGSPEHSYVGLMLDAARTIVDALGGDPSRLDAVDPAG